MIENDLVMRAKALVEELRPQGHEDRKWLASDPVASYGADSNAVRLHVLEGSPPRAYLIEKDVEVLILDARMSVVCRVRDMHGSIEVTMGRTSWWWVERYQGEWRLDDDELW